MSRIQKLLTEHIELWTAADTGPKSGRGRSAANASKVYGISKLRELILELAVRGKLVPQDAGDEPASELLKRIQVEKAMLIAEGKIKKDSLPEDIAEEEKPFNLPGGWEWVRFSDYSIDIATGPFGSMIHQSDYVKGGVPLINPSHMINDKIIHDENVSVTGVVAKNLFAYSIFDGDIVMARRGDVGRIALVTERENGWICGTGSFVIRFSKDVSRDYLRVVFRCNRVRTYLAGKAVGTTMVNLNHGILKSMPFGLPPLAEQGRIVAKVDELMALCDQLEAEHNNASAAHEKLVSQLLGTLTQSAARGEPVPQGGVRRGIEPRPSTDSANSPSGKTEFEENWQRIAAHFDTLFTTEASIDALKQTLLQLAVMGKLVPQDPNDEPASELLKNIRKEKDKLIAEGKIKKDKPLPPITDEEKPFALPSGWEWVRLGDHVLESGAGWSPNCEGRPRTGNEWGVLKVSAVSWGIFLPEENKALPANLQPRLDCAVKAGDFLVSRANTAELVARSVYVDDCPKHLMLSDKIVRLRISSQCSGRFLNLANLCQYSRGYYSSVAGGTSSSMRNVTREQILNLPFALPPLPEQHRIVAKVDELMALCDQLKAQLLAAGEQQRKLADVLVKHAVAGQEA